MLAVVLSEYLEHAAWPGRATGASQEPHAVSLTGVAFNTPCQLQSCPKITGIVLESSTLCHQYGTSILSQEFSKNIVVAPHNYLAALTLCDRHSGNLGALSAIPREPSSIQAFLVESIKVQHST
jgi:hypothetical protein